VVDLDRRIAELSPEKREMLLRWMAEERGDDPEAAPAEIGLPELVPREEERHEPFPLTPVQETYWAGRSGLYDLAGAGTNIYQELELTGRVEPAMERIHDALQRLIAHHDMLRAELVPGDGELLQRVRPSVPEYRIEVDDLRSMDREEAEREVDRMRREMCTRTAPVDRWPLFEIRGQRLDDDRVRLHTRFEPFLMDGEGRAHIVYQLFRLFEDPSYPLPSIGCTYRDYAVTWRELQETDRFRDARDYWLGRVPDLPPAPELPLLAEPTPRTRPDYGRKRMTLEPELWRRLKARAGRWGLTPSAVILAAFGDVMVRWSGASRFTLCAVGSYRPPIHPDIHDVVGNFNTITPLEVDATPDTFGARARRLQDRISADLEHPYFSGFETLRGLNRHRGVSSRPFLPVWFNSVVEYSHPAYRREASGMIAGSELGEIRYLDLIMYPPQSSFLTTAGESADGSMWAIWQWVEELFPEGMVPEMVAAYGRALRRLAVDEPAWEETGTVVALPAETCAPGPPRPVAPGAASDSAARALAGRERVQVVGPWGEPCPPWVYGRVVAAAEPGSEGLAGDGPPDAVSDRSSSVPRIVGRRRPDGAVEIRGREEEVRARVLGYAVDPAHVAARLEELPEVGEAIVVPFERGLVAHATAASGVDLDPEATLARLEDELPYYAVPLRLVVWDDLPRLEGGAPDRARLVEHGPGEEDAVRAPAAALDSMAGLWSEILGREPETADEDFFSSGGDSLKAVRLIRAIETRFGVSLPIGVLVMWPTLGALTRAVDLRARSASRREDNEPEENR
jgi:acyl carrier protein